jgi:hypothetical protein
LRSPPSWKRRCRLPVSNCPPNGNRQLATGNWQPATGNWQLPPHKRALLIGINDYSASHLPRQSAAAPDRDWPNLSGSVNDVVSMRAMLMLLHRFEARDIVVLTDQAATRVAIVQAIETQLIAPARPADPRRVHLGVDPRDARCRARPSSRA